jgi:hypothetical protein
MATMHRPRPIPTSHLPAIIIVLLETYLLDTTSI